MHRTVEDVMTKTVVVVRDSASFKEIVRLMDEFRVSALPVIDSTDAVVGIVSEADLLLKEENPRAQEDAPLLETPRRRRERAKAGAMVAAQLMTTPVVTIGPGASLAEAARLMHQHGVKRLPVVDGTRKLLGIVSRVDLLRIFLRDDAEIRGEVVNDILERTMWVEPDRVQVAVKEGVVSLEGQLEHRSSIAVLARMVMSVDGVVGVDNRLSFEVDDLNVPTDMIAPWGFVPRVTRG